MNRRKKAKQSFEKKLKRARAKLQPENQKNAKPKYISKADRAKLEQAQEEPQSTTSEPAI